MLVLALLVGAAFLARLWLRAVWGQCFAPDCAYLPVPPILGGLFVLGVHLSLLAAGLVQWRLHARSVGTREWSLWAIVGITGAALAWRLSRVWINPFEHDQAVALELAGNIIWQGRLPLIGEITSQRVPHWPGYIYLLLPATLAGRDPFGQAVLASLYGALSVFTVGIVSRRWVGPVAGITAASLIAVGYWPMRCGSQVWEPCFMLPWIPLLLDALLLLVVARLGWALPLVAFWVATTTNMHVLGLLFVPVAGVSALLSWRATRPLQWLAAAAIFLLVLAPWVVWQAAPNVFFNDVRRLVQVSSGPEARIDFSPLRDLWDLAGSGSASLLVPAPVRDTFEDSTSLRGLAAPGPWLTLLGLVVCLLWLVLPTRGDRRRVFAVLLLFLGLPLLPTIRSSAGSSISYLYWAMPLLATLAGVAASQVWLAIRRRTGPALPALLLAGALSSYAIASVNAVQTLDFFATNVGASGYVPANSTWSTVQRVRETQRQSGGQTPLFIGGHPNDTRALLYALGDSAAAPIAFDDCREVPRARAPGSAVVFLWYADSPLLDYLGVRGQAQLLERPGPWRHALVTVDAALLDGREIPPLVARASSADCQVRIPPPEEG